MKPARIQRPVPNATTCRAASRVINGLLCISATLPGRWGNPYDIRRFGRELAMELFRNGVQGRLEPGPRKERIPNSVTWPMQLIIAS
jgi:hypothetical protein